MTSPLDLFPPPWLGEWLPRQYADQPSSVTFPSTNLRIIVRIALNADFTADPSTWAWEDISQYVRYADGISTTNGRRDWSSTADTKTASLRLDNRDGRFSRRNPYGPYYGKLSRNTPIWLSVDAGDGEHTRWQGFVNEWPRRFNKAATDFTVPISCAGVFRRLSSNSQAVSPLKRSILGENTSAPVGFWPLEDGSNATSLATPITGATPGQIWTGVTPGSAGPAGAVSAISAVSPTVGVVSTVSSGTGNFTLSIPTHTVGTTETFTFWIQGTPWASPPSGGVSLILWHRVSFAPGGSFANLIIGTISHDPVNFPGGSNRGIAAYFYGPTLPLIGNVITQNTTPLFDPFDGNWHEIQIRVTQSGSDVTAIIYGDGVQISIVLTMSSRTLTAMTSFTAGTAGGYLDNTEATFISFTAPYSIGAVSVHNTTPTSFYQAGTGYVGEQAHTRVARVAAEIGVPSYGLGHTSVEMGPQPISDTVAIWRDAETTDQGFLYEAGYGVGFQTTDERTNAPVAMTLDFDLGQIAEPPEPADDDQQTVNRWTSSRSGGSTAIVQDATAVADDAVYDGGGTVNVQLDSQLGHDAGWHIHKGTIDEDRWPSIPLRFHRSTELIPTWTTLPFGSRINAIHPPDDGPPDAIDAFIEGWAEQWNSRTWGAVLNTSPASPFDVGVLSDSTSNPPAKRGWLTFVSCVLAADVDTTATSWSITCSPAETSSAACFPRPMTIDGEDITVTASTGGTSPTWTVTRSTNTVVKAHSAGATVVMSRPLVLTLS